MFLVVMQKLLRNFILLIKAINDKEVVLQDIAVSLKAINDEKAKIEAAAALKALAAKKKTALMRLEELRRRYALKVRFDQWVATARAEKAAQLAAQREAEAKARAEKSQRAEEKAQRAHQVAVQALHEAQMRKTEALAELQNYIDGNKDQVATLTETLINNHSHIKQFKVKALPVILKWFETGKEPSPAVIIGKASAGVLISTLKDQIKNPARGGTKRDLKELFQNCADLRRAVVATEQAVTEKLNALDRESAGAGAASTKK